MFTVIFAEKETLKLFEEMKMFFGPLYHSENVAFCEWNKEATDLATMVPDLYELISYHNEWRALILYDDGLHQLNPFDFTGYSEPFYSKNNLDWALLQNRRQQRMAAYEKAVENPLVKLTTALSGITSFNSSLSQEDYTRIISGEMQPYEYMLVQQLKQINCVELAIKLEKYQRDVLKRFVAEQEIGRLISFIKSSDVSGILQLISDTEILDFIKFIGNDPIYYDVEYTECLIETTKKQSLLKAIAKDFSMKDKLPDEVICFSPRTFDFEKVEQEIKWKKKDELSSSKFVNYNLYHDKLQFILCDLIEKDNKQYRFDQIKLLCLLLVLANYQTPKGMICANHVYKADIEFDDNIVTEVCENYLSKLKATQVLLKDIEVQLERESETSIDNQTAQRIFESDISIPVKMESSYNENDLYGEYSALGLSTDCPQQEDSYWAGQYRKIIKSFNRYLRGPKRAVKTAVSEELRSNCFVDDDRSLILSENQVEDVCFHLYETEQKMVESTTTAIFNTRQFTEQIQEADKEVRRGIAQRMTKKATVITGLIALLAYFIGFLPLLFSNVNTVKSFLFSLGVTGVAMAAFLVVGFVFLFVLRKRLVNRIKHFNYVMGGICSSIQNALIRFSTYISCVCNVMRDFSVLRKRDSAVERTKRILEYHRMCISKQTENVYDMFSRYVDFNNIKLKECDPYEYDFKILKDYAYEMPTMYALKRIEYCQKGNEILLPVDYVDSVTLTREELYD